MQVHGAFHVFAEHSFLVLFPGILGDARTDVSFQSTRVQGSTGLGFRVTYEGVPVNQICWSFMGIMEKKTELLHYTRVI